MGDVQKRARGEGADVAPRPSKIYRDVRALSLSEPPAAGEASPAADEAPPPPGEAPPPLDEAPPPPDEARPMEEEERPPVQEEPSRYPLHDYGCPELQEVMRRTAGRLGQEGWCAGGWPDEELEPANTLAAAGFRAAVRWVESNSHRINLDDKVLDHRSRAKSEMKPAYVSYACLLAAFIHCGYVDPDNVCITSSDGRRIGTKWFEGVAADVLLKVSTAADPVPPSFRNCTAREICAAAEEGSADALAILCAQPHVLVRKGPSEYVSGSALARWKDPGIGGFNLMDLSVRANTTTGEEEERRYKLVKVLLTHGYELNTEDDSSLHEAAKLGLCTIIACLLESGANPLIVRPLGGVPQSAIEVARRQGQRQACELLERHACADNERAAKVEYLLEMRSRSLRRLLEVASPSYIPSATEMQDFDDLVAHGPRLQPIELFPPSISEPAYQRLCWLRDELTRIAPGLALLWTLIPAEALQSLSPLATHNGENSSVFTARYDDKKVFVKRVPNGEDAVREVYKLVHRQHQEACGQYFAPTNSKARSRLSHSSERAVGF